MCRGSLAAALALRTLAAAALLIGKSEGGKCERSTANPCSNDTDCVPTIGPTKCVDNQCFCEESFCWAKADNDAADSAQMRCRARVGSCDILKKVLGCESGKGGPHAVECIEGQCLCHSGYHADSDGHCQFGWWPPHQLAMLRNDTEAYGNLQRLSLRWQQAWQLPTMPASMLPAYALVLCSTLTVAACVALQRHRRGSAASVTSPSAFAVERASGDCIEEACYEPLASSPLSFGGDGNTDNTRGSSALH